MPIKNIIAQGTTIDLNNEWFFSEAGSDQWLPAEIPGTVHTDLLSNDIIQDPHYHLNENGVQWIEERDWIYKTTFTADPDLLNSKKIELILEGLDTHSDVYLNDHLILEADNMFIGWEVDVKEYLREGQNELLIYFHSPVKVGMKKLSKIDYYIPAINEQAPMDQRTSVFTRKAPFHYGWDWGPRLVTSGIWRPVSLRGWDEGRIESVYVDTKYILENEAWLYGTTEIEIIEPGEYRFSLNLDDQINAIEIESDLDVVNRNSPGTPYWSSSPSSYGNTLADRRSGDEHDWTIWFGQEPFSSYGRNVPRFISEYGMQAFPGMHTIREFAEPSDFELDSEVMRHRQRGTMEYIEPGFDGNDMIKRYMQRYYPVPEQFDEFVYVSQIMHGMAYKTAIEAHRRNMPVTMGSLYWQLNDSWPTISWATVDYYGRWKAAHYKVRDAYRETIISPVVEENEVQIYIISDRIALGDAGTLVVKITDFFGRVAHEVKTDVNLPENSSELVYSLSFEEIHQYISDFETSDYYLSASLSTDENDSIENILFFEKPSDLRLPKADIEYELLRDGSGYVMSLRSDVFVKDLYIEADENSLHFSDNFFDLEAGVLKEVRISSEKEVSYDPEFRFYSVNQLMQSTKSD